MNIKQIIAAVVTFSAAGAALSDTMYPPETSFASIKTRSEVVAELQEARAQGLINRSNNPSLYPQNTSVAQIKTRAEVLAELQDARDQGLINRSNNPAFSSVQSSGSNMKIKHDVKAISDKRTVFAGA